MEPELAAELSLGTIRRVSGFQPSCAQLRLSANWLGGRQLRTELAAAPRRLAAQNKMPKKENKKKQLWLAATINKTHTYGRTHARTHVRTYDYVLTYDYVVRTYVRIFVFPRDLVRYCVRTNARTYVHTYVVDVT